MANWRKLYFNYYKIHSYLFFWLLSNSDQASRRSLQHFCTLSGFKRGLNNNISFLLYFFPYLAENWAPSSEFVSSSIPSWQILTAHAQPFRGARDLAFCLKVPLDSQLIWASSEGSGETAWMRRLAWTFAPRIGYKYQIGLTRSN